MKADTKQNLSCNVVPGATGIHWFKDDETAEITTAETMTAESTMTASQRDLTLHRYATAVSA